VSRELVIDCSVAASWFLPDECTESCQRLLGFVARGELRVVVPELWHYEVLNALRTAVLRGRITQPEAYLAATKLRGLPVEAVPVRSQGHAAIVSAAVQLGLSAYDAAYVSLAEGRGIDLVTADRGMLALKPERPWIRSAEEFLAED